MRDASDSGVQPVTWSNWREATDILSRAFSDDPIAEYVIPEQGKREQGLQAYMGLAVRYGLRYGRVETTTGELKAVSVWLPPGDAPAGLGRLIRSGFLKVPFVLGIEGTKRMMAFTNLTEKHHKAVAKKHWYLWLLGVDPPFQGKGVGGATIQPVLKDADTGNLPCYLESSKERNVPFYEKHGFTVTKEVQLDGGPPIWLMTREPVR